MKPQGRSQRRVPVVELSSDSDSDVVPLTQRKRRCISSDDDFDPNSEKMGQKKAKAAVRKPSKYIDSASESSSDNEREGIKNCKDSPSASANLTNEKTSTISKQPRKRKSPLEHESPLPKKKKIKNEKVVRKNKTEDKVESGDKSRATTRKKSESSTKNKRSKDEVENNSKNDGKKSAKYYNMAWSEPEYLAELEDIDYDVASTVIELFDDDNTIPFIARYRQEMTGYMTPEKLRHVKESYESIREIKRKAKLIVKTIEKAGKMTADLEQSIKCARDIEQLEHIYAPFKPETKRELAAKAKAIGLEPPALTVLNGSDFVTPKEFVNADVKGLETKEEVKKGIQHIIAHIISKDAEVLSFLRKECESHQIILQSTEAASRTKTTEKLATKASKDEESKFSTYYNFSCPITHLKSHQVLALNRGEKLKELSVRIVFPSWIETKLMSLCEKKWFQKGSVYPFRHLVCKDSVKDAYSRLLQPLMTRSIRAELNKNAERESIEVFAQNLKNLLLTPPYKGHPVLAIDPGFSHGCKSALISATGTLLEYKVLYLHSISSVSAGAQWLQTVMLKHECEVIAIGNGVGCRETEYFISSLIKKNFFDPLKVRYTVVSEQGVSIYSCSEEAEKDLPNMDPTVRSAISIARRLQDPLTEMVKVEPRHLGVGMYQHDLPDKALASTLQEVVIECVSFVGVDLNTAPHCVLKQIAGIGEARAEQIIKWREKNGSFFNRDQLNEVKGIGQKTFEQCAGFLRILPDTVNPGDRWKLCPLDRTWIHPESYPFAMKFIEDNRLQLNSIGCESFRKEVQEAVSSFGGEEGIARRYNVSKDLADLVIRGLLSPINYDIRSEFEKPIFRQSITSMTDLKVGTKLRGRVSNTTSFGSFVDVGVGVDGLIHVTGMKGKSVRLGDLVEVTVKHVEPGRRRIGLILESVL